MYQKSFVKPDSIVRQIWGQSDMILFIFAASAAEFALNKEVDWLYFTGKLPQDPLGRMFSTLGYARSIIWMEEQQAIATIEKMKAIHHTVEDNRKQVIPETAYRDVLYMLIAASIKAHEVLEHPLKMHEKQEIFEVFSRMGNLMGIKGISKDYADWTKDREDHLATHLSPTTFTKDLYDQYRYHLGAWRYYLLLVIQAKMTDNKVFALLRKRLQYRAGHIIHLYRYVRKKHWLKKRIPLLMPAPFRQSMRELNRLPSGLH